MKLWVGIAAYNRMLCCETARSLLNEQGAARLLDGVEIEVGFAPGCCALHYARDILVRQFLLSKADKLIFVDSDVAFEPGMLLKLALHPVDIVGGATRLKKEPEQYPVVFAPSENGELWADPKTGLLEVTLMPAGFLAISRDALLMIQAAHPERAYVHDETEHFHGFFQCPYGSTEEGPFFNDWRALGGKCWLDPEIELTHIDGPGRFTGRMGDYLRRRIPLQAAA